MSPEQWARVKDLFDSALEHEPDRRIGFLERACAGDRELLVEVQAMVASFEEHPEFMDDLMSAGGVCHQPEPADAGEDTCAGPYKLLRRVGSGGMAFVYIAARVDQQFKKLVAVKVVKPGMDSEEIVRRFRKERQLLASLEHANIARLLDGGTTARGMPYLVMEYVQGTPIDAYCDSHALSVAERLVLFRQVCSAVQYAHQKLLVHRDLKPGNILVTVDGVPKLLDFGIAKLLVPDYSEETPNPTRTNLRLMTPEFASPEQVHGDPITTTSDVYALGVLLYKLLTGHSPYRITAQTTAAIEEAICSSEPERPSVAVTRLESTPASEGTTAIPTPEAVSKNRQTRPDKLCRCLRGDLDVIVLNALRKEPQRRYPSVEALSEDIHRHLMGLPIKAHKDTWNYRAGKFMRRNRAGVAVTVAVALALIASTGVSVYYAYAARAQKIMAVQLARSLLDFDTAVQSGLTPARKAFLTKVLGQLNQLSPDAANDRSLREMLIEAYFKVGDLQGNLNRPNLGDAAAAKRSYQQALVLAEAAVRSDPANQKYQRDLAFAKLRLGDIAAQTGDRRGALEQYRRTEAALEGVLSANPRQPEIIRDVLQIFRKIGLTEQQLGDQPAALQSYRRYLQFAGELAAIEGPTAAVRRDLAFGEEHVGDMLVNIGSPMEGLTRLRSALRSYQKSLEEEPADTRLQRSVGLATLRIGDALVRIPRLEEAEEVYRRGVETLESLHNADPRNQQYQRDLNTALDGLRRVLESRGRMREARQVTERSLAELEPLVNQAEPVLHDLHQYCWLLLNTPFKDLRNPALVLKYATKAVDLTAGSDPALLDILARAYYGNGDAARAVETERQALSLVPQPLPGGAVSSLRKEFEANLARFQDGLAHKQALAARQQP
jgi:serine/threonine protein kinase/tetratricopeptide (TPR) repeat protein